MTRPLLLLPLMIALSASEARAEPAEAETPAASASCAEVNDDAETRRDRAAPSVAKSAGTAAPVRSSAPGRTSAPRWNSLLPGMFR